MYPYGTRVVVNGGGILVENCKNREYAIQEYRNNYTIENKKGVVEGYKQIGNRSRLYYIKFDDGTYGVEIAEQYLLYSS